MMSECAKCRNKTKTDGFVGCEGPCQKWFHYSCIGMGDSEFKVLHKSKNLVYICDFCRRKCEFVEKINTTKMKDSLVNLDQNVETLSKDLNEINMPKIVRDEINNFCGKINDMFNSFKNTLLLTLEDKIKELHTSSNSSNDLPGEQKGRPLYSSVLSCSSNVVCIKPKNVNQSNVMTRSEMLHNINPVDASIHVSKIKNIREGGVVVSCSSNEEVGKFKHLADSKLSSNYEIKELNAVKPRIRIVGLTDKHDADVLITYLKKQNKHVFLENCSIDVIDVIPLKKNNRVFQAKLSLDIDSYKRAIHESSLFVGYDCCSVYDAIELRMCYRCCGFAHIAKNCNRDRKCPKCSEDHGIGECGITDEKLFKCFNCISRGNTSFNHAAWSSQCPVFLEKLGKFKSDMFNLK